MQTRFSISYNNKYHLYAVLVTYYLLRLPTINDRSIYRLVLVICTYNIGTICWKEVGTFVAERTTY